MAFLAGAVFVSGMGLAKVGMRRLGALQERERGASDDIPSKDLPGQVRELLSSAQWQSLSGTKHSDVLKKLQLIADVGCPPMMVLSSKALARQGYLPSFSEGLALDARTVLQEDAVIIFVSHRWLRSSEQQPDSEDRTKFKALIAFAHYYEHYYNSGWGGGAAAAAASGREPKRNVYFWIDYSCIDPENIQDGIQSLPLYVASAMDLLIFDTSDYSQRAWCSTELTLAYKFMFAGRIPWVVGASLAETPVRPDLFRVRPEERLLRDPTGGLLSSEGDRSHVEGLVRCAVDANAWVGGEDRALEFGKTTISAQTVMAPQEYSEKYATARRAAMAARRKKLVGSGNSGGCAQS